MNRPESARPPSRMRRLIRFLRDRWHKYKIEREWKRQGCPLPIPSHIKRAFLRKYARAHGLRVFVETGTLYGDTLAALRGDFDELHSIELGDELYAAAAARFAGDQGITVWHGDSGELLARVLAQIDAPALFWLDGHYSGQGTARGREDTPVRRELEHIARHPLRERHHIIIDDLRYFSGMNGYPDVAAVKELALRLGFRLSEEVNDCLIIRATAEQRRSDLGDTKA